MERKCANRTILEKLFFLITSYLENSYNVVFTYIIKKEDLKKIMTSFKQYTLSFVVLLTDPETLLCRDKERPLDCQMGERRLLLLKEFQKENFEQKNILDTSNHSVQEICDKIRNNQNFQL